VVSQLLWVSGMPRVKLDKLCNPVFLMYSTCQEFGLARFVVDSVMSGVYISKAQFKTKVKSVLWQKETDSFLATMLLYKNLKLYKDVIRVGNVWPWWSFGMFKPTYARKCRILLRLLTANHAINERLCKIGASRYCQECVFMVDDTLPHMLFVCPGMAVTRDTGCARVL
jgi:hypothetical protein